MRLPATFIKTLLLCIICAILSLVTPCVGAADTINLGSQRELFVDNFLIATKTNVQLTLHEPRDEGPAFSFDAPWEGRFCAYVTLIHDGDHFRAYYRGRADASRDGVSESTCVAESTDGRNWTK